MGRIKTKLVKRISNEILHEYKDRLKKSFEENKTAVANLVIFPSKKLRNVVAGYVARLMKKTDEENKYQ